MLFLYAGVIMISYIGANKHHRQPKFVRRSTKHSEVQSTCKMSRGWMMRRELRCEGLVGRARRAMARSIEGTRSFYGFKLLVLYAVSICWCDKHHRQRNFVRRSTKRSVVQSTCKMSRGWMMRSELRCSRFRWESYPNSLSLDSVGLVKHRRYNINIWFKLLVSIC